MRKLRREEWRGDIMRREEKSSHSIYADDADFFHKNVQPVNDAEAGNLFDEVSTIVGRTYLRSRLLPRLRDKMKYGLAHLAAFDRTK